MTMLRILGRSLAYGLFLTALFGCSGGGNDPSPADNDNDRKIILTHWVDNIISPSYANFKVKFDVMHDKAHTFIEFPNNTSLVEFRASWVDAYAQWQKTELFEFGPADTYTLRNFFNIYPADVAGISASIADPAISLEFPSAYARQGFPAFDYLLNGVGADDASIIAYYVDAAEGPKRIAFVKKLIDRMHTLLTNVISGWSTSYRETFINKTGLDIGSSTGLVVNAFVLHYERYIRTGKFGIPSGTSVAGGGVPYPEKVEAFYKKDISLTLAKNAHQAAFDFFKGVDVNTGAEGPSLKSYLDAIEAKDASSGTLLSAIISDQFSVINTKLDVLAPNLFLEAKNNNQAMIDVYTEMQKLVRILKVDMTSAMSVTITYTDNDGD